MSIKVKVPCAISEDDFTELFLHTTRVSISTTQRDKKCTIFLTRSEFSNFLDKLVDANRKIQKELAIEMLKED